MDLDNSLVGGEGNTRLTSLAGKTQLLTYLDAGFLSKLANQITLTEMSIPTMEARQKKWLLMSVAGLLSIFFWGCLVQCALAKVTEILIDFKFQSKSSAIEIQFIKQEEKMTTIEKLVYMNREKKKRQQRKEEFDQTQISV